MIAPPVLPVTFPINRHAFLRDRLRPLCEPAILLLWCIFLFGYGIGVGTLYRTEALRAIIGREALQGSWLVPTLYGEPFLTKPPGMYAAIAAASLPFGEVTAVSARLPSVLAATITVFLFFAAFRRIVERKLALAGAMLMPVSILWLNKAPSAEIDMLQLAWVSAALLCFLRALEAEDAFTFRIVASPPPPPSPRSGGRESHPPPASGRGQGGGGIPSRGGCSRYFASPPVSTRNGRLPRSST